MEIEQRFQNVSYLNTHIQHTGCKYIDIVNIYQDVAEHQVEYEMINAVWVMTQRIKNFDGYPYMRKDCFVYDVNGLSQLLSGLTNIPVSISEVKSYEVYTNVLGLFRRTTNGGIVVDHFVELFLDSDKVKRDPWFPASKTARVGKLISKRFINARRL